MIDRPGEEPLRYGQCSGCGFQCWCDADGEEEYLIEIKDRRDVMTDYGPGENWTEVWKCPYCGNVFEEGNGYP